MSKSGSVTLTAAGVEATLLSAGASIRSILLQDRDGKKDDIVLGHPTEEDYLVSFANDQAYFSSTSAICL